MTEVEKQSMNGYDKFKKYSRPYVIIAGMGLVIAGLTTGIPYYYFGFIPLMMGVLDVCIVCSITQKCTN